MAASDPRRCAARTIGSALALGVRALSRAGVEDARLDAEILLAAALRATREQLFAARRDAPLEDAAARRFAALLRRRAAREPVAYLLGRREFHGLEFDVGPGVLVPRPETELLVASAIEALRLRARREVRALDVGTGSGCIAVAVGASLAHARVVALDRSAEALAYARRNVDRHGLGARVRLVRGDIRTLHAAFRGAAFDAIVANPPYVAARDVAGDLAHEPRSALVCDFGEFPAVYRALADAARALLLPGGSLLLEVGAGQAGEVAEILGAAGYLRVRADQDLAGIPRVVAGSVGEERSGA